MDDAQCRGGTPHHLAVAAYVERIVDGAPALTPEQRDRLAVLLLGGPPPREVVRSTPEAQAAA
jgi:hypothetical protein